MDPEVRADLAVPFPLVKGPFVSLSEALAKGEPIEKLASAARLHSVMPGLIGYPTMTGPARG